MTRCWRRSPASTTPVEVVEPVRVTGARRLAGKNTLNRLELTPVDANACSRYKKIVVDEQELDRLWVSHFI